MTTSVFTKQVTCLLLFMGVMTARGQHSGSGAGLPPGLDNYVKEALQAFEVPGASLAVVRDGTVLLAKGYGIKKLGTPETVDEHTLFPIASNTKAFTATALALLVEEGKIGWDDPVRDYLPWFRMSDPLVTNLLTIRDLLVHRSGLPPYAGDLLQFPPTTYSRKEVVQKLRFIPLTGSFRNSYAYDNILYLAAAEVIEAVSGQEWEEFVQTRILDQVGMPESITRFSEFQSRPNRAFSHAPFDGKVRVVERFFEQGLGDISDPAGGIVSNAADMAKWMITQLDSGRTTGGSRLFPPAATGELWKMVTPIPARQVPEWIKPAQRDFWGYALAFHVYGYRGRKVVSHGGKLDGFVSRVTLVPDLNLGITILTNQESRYVIDAVVNHILDHYLEAEPFDWMAGYQQEETIRLDRIARQEKEALAVRDTTSGPSLPPQGYAGIYQDPWYGEMTIAMEGDSLAMRFDHTPALVGRMEHWQYDTFIVRWDNRELKADAFVTFSLRHDGQIDQVKMKAVSPVTDVSYDFHDLLFRPVHDK